MGTDKRKDKTFISVRDICLMALLTATILIQETALSFIPSVNFTHLFIALAFYLLGLPKTLIVVFCYTLLDNLIMGSFSLAYTPTIVIMWLLYPCMLHFASKRFKSRRIMPALVSAIHALLYSWAFVLVFVVFYQVPFGAYVIADLPYEAVLIVVAFVTVFLLLPPILKVLEPLLKKNKGNETSKS